MNPRTLACGSFLTLLLALAGCGGRDTGWRVRSDTDRGYSVEFPDSWHVAVQRMSRISEPRELFTVGTAALEWRPTNCEAFAGAAGASMSPADVVVTVWERGLDRGSSWSDFPPRPAAFGPVGNGERAEGNCGEPEGTATHWRNFSDAGRHFHTLVRIGPEASAESAEEAWRILDRLTLDPDYQPGWRASG
jgi:hypothetical protein